MQNKASLILKRLTNYRRFSTTRIVIRGYEDGYNDILQLLPVKIKLNVNEHWYEGAHEKSFDNEGSEAVELYGDNKNAKD